MATLQIASQSLRPLMGFPKSAGLILHPLKAREARLRKWLGCPGWRGATQTSLLFYPSTRYCLSAAFPHLLCCEILLDIALEVDAARHSEWQMSHNLFVKCA